LFLSILSNLFNRIIGSENFWIAHTLVKPLAKSELPKCIAKIGSVYGAKTGITQERRISLNLAV